MSRHGSAPRRPGSLIGPLLVLFCTLLDTPAHGVTDIELELGDLAGEGWRLSAAGLSWAWREGASGRVRLHADSLEIDAVPGALAALEVTCETTSLDSSSVACDRAGIALDHPQLGHVQGAASVAVDLSGGTLALRGDLDGPCGGRLALNIDLGPGGGSLAWQGSGLELACLAGFAPEGSLPKTEALGGQVDVDGSWQFVAGGDREAHAVLHGRGVSFATPDGRLAAEALDLDIVAGFDDVAGGKRFTLDVALGNGALYLEPLLIDAVAAPLKLTAAGSLGEARLDIDRLSAVQEAVATIEGRFSLARTGGTVLDADLELRSEHLDQLYRHLLQPFLVGTALDELEAGGQLRARLRRGESGWDAALDLVGVDLADRRGRFALGGISGALAWGETTPHPGRITWRGGHLLRLALGPSEIALAAGGRGIALHAPWRQPLVDGALRVARLEAGFDASGDLRAELDAELEPVSLAALSGVFGWPPLAGQVAGRLPGLALGGHRLTLGGVLEVEAFAGSMRVSDLVVEEPLGVLPRLQADVAIAALDLEQVTRAFPIGRITGKLDGRIDGLVLAGWRPVRFDASLQTPVGDRSRRRISQKAVESLSRLGGLGGVLSRSVLRFFDDFGYARLGITCRLRGALCELGGVEEAAQGYYLVKGGGLPRIDVIGHVRRVDWQELLDRLRRAMASPAPVVR